MSWCDREKAGLEGECTAGQFLDMNRCSLRSSLEATVGWELSNSDGILKCEAMESQDVAEF